MSDGVMEEFPPHEVVEPGTVRVGLYEGRPFYQCEHMRDIAILHNTSWHVDCAEPLTVSPSILNAECGCHGFIRKGQWVPV